MSLPANYENSEAYFRDSLLFFKQYQHLFKYPNTEILVEKVLQQIDVENFERTKVFDKDFELVSIIETNCFLQEFFNKLNRFQVSYEDFSGDISLESKVDVPLSPKKKHEIIYLTKEIKDNCDNNNCEIVVDFGSGLGYLDQLIYESSNLKVLGIECNEGHYVGAKKRQRKYHLDSVHNVKYIKHTINENSDKKIQEYLIDKFEKRGNFCVTGLHACADLSIDGANLFLKMDDAKTLVLMPCCYHKMALDSSGFKNFPLSDCLKRNFEENNGTDYLKIPFLRLGAQPPNKGEDLEESVFNLLARATLQLYAHRHNCKLKRNKRKAVKTKTVDKNFTNYLQNAAKGFTLTREIQPSSEDVRDEIIFDFEELQAIWRETQNLTVEAAIFVLIQNCLQPVIENFILYDRVNYLMEKGLKRCCFKKIFNEKISPRCLALVGVK